MAIKSFHKLLHSIDNTADVILVALYFLVVSAILFRVQVESTGYISPDSEAYLGLVQNLLDGHGFYVLKEDNIRHYFSTWPVGYPVLIFLIAKVSGLSAFWASKILNLIVLGLGFLTVRIICRAYSFVLASIYGAYSFIEVYSFTWSEAPFLLGILVLCYLSSLAYQKPEALRYCLYTFFTCLLLFLVRYVGAFSFCVPGLLAVYFLFKRQTKPAIVYSIATLLLATLAALYLYTNYKLSGYITGFDRLEEETESVGGFILMLTRGLSNEFLIIRKYRSAAQPDYLFYTTAILQTIALVYVYTCLKSANNFAEKIKKSSFALTCIFVAGLYFISILILRQVSHFDDLDYRLLSPFSFLVLFAIIYILVSLPDQLRGAKRAKYTVFAFFLLSLLLNLPKEYILAQLKQLW